MKEYNFYTFPELKYAVEKRIPPLALDGLFRESAELFDNNPVAPTTAIGWVAVMRYSEKQEEVARLFDESSSDAQAILVTTIPAIVSEWQDFLKNGPVWDGEGDC